MNISSEISFIHESNSSHYFLNGTEVNGFDMFSIVYIISILMSLLLNSYVIWLIVTRTGNGLASEFFILNLSVCEILLCLETLLRFLNFALKIPWIVVAYLDGLFIMGRPVFQCLICVERYLAVVHPIIFLKFKPFRYRLMCSAVAWFTTFVFFGFNALNLSVDFKVYFIFLIVIFSILHSVQLFCCVAVLRVLKQSGPGERGREREEENHMKKRAFYIILISTVTTVIIYTTYSILIFLPVAENTILTKICFVQFCYIFAGLVQPVLFLYRVRKLNFIKSCFDL